MLNFTELFQKYDVPVPRYTSYPAILNWKNNLTPENWINNLSSAFENSNTEWSIYIHLPFCESLCTFCACNNIITRDHSKEFNYISAIHKEWSLYQNKVPNMKKAKLKQIHLGGGSPTFFQPEHLRELLAPILAGTTRDPDSFEGAVEVDPRRCTKEHLRVLRDLGFNRISLGVQDFDLKVQKLVNRIQPYDMVEQCLNSAREMGYRSTNFDLIYGLPGQTLESMKDTAQKTLELRPERIALYSLAVVPWIKPAQRRFKEDDLLKGQNKRDLYELARSIFLDAGYIEMGIDHFALPTDTMALAYKNGTLHRNFMGYTEYSTDVLLGLGVSAISETSNSFHQNQKKLNEYYKFTDSGELPFERGHELSYEDQFTRKQILDLMTKETVKIDNYKKFEEKLFPMITDGLITHESGVLKVTPRGKPFIRNICAGLDPYIHSQSRLGTYSSGV